MSPLQKGHFTAKRRHLHRTAFPGTARQGRCGGLRGEKGFCSAVMDACILLLAGKLINEIGPRD